MTITTIETVDATNPVEVQTWLDANPSVVLLHVMVQGNLFYVLY